MDPVRAERLSKKYGNFEAVKGVSFRVGKGELYALLGPNGAGKTTTIKMLSTLLKPTSGDGYVMGYSVVREPKEVRKVIGVVPQDLTADDELTGLYNVYLQARLYGYSSSEAMERAKRALEIVGLTESAERRVSTYSGGMRRRLEIAMSLVHDPPVLFLDEPTLGLDVQTRRTIWDLIREFQKEGRSLILTTHYMEEAETLASRVGIIDLGVLKAEGTPEELKSKLRGDRLYVELYSDEDANALVREMTIAGLEVKGDSSQIVVSMQSEEVLRKVIGLLNGKRVRSINIVKPNLEEVFIEITGRRLREESFDAFRQRVFMRKVR
ncbi:MAG: ATP-binding cassette domain-containing protein [Acidilobaceae archaeon]|nr:ATP-binding cassette domain-containing protein [Acidilobaceae archaeon]MCX8165762.1 ATP-binding cassette domain-containing protein [Acidilobaceae archaeon]MDW7974187.1 ATP-binding cassette domain-containing protein [Sulfolobales archaeon]